MMPGDPGEAFGQLIHLVGNGEDVADLPVRYDLGGFWSAWALSEEERRAIADGAPVLLYVVQTRGGFPPVSLAVAGVVECDGERGGGPKT